MFTIFRPPQFTTQLPESVNSPITVASTPRLCIRFRNTSHFFFGTERVMRSWDSEIQISHGRRLGYFKGTRPRSTSPPPHSLAISATEQDMPPAPLSVMLEYRFIARASRTMASENFF